jgi:hypothetical protein
MTIDTDRQAANTLRRSVIATHIVFTKLGLEQFFFESYLEIIENTNVGSISRCPSSASGPSRFD